MLRVPAIKTARALGAHVVSRARAAASASDPLVKADLKLARKHQPAAYLRSEVLLRLGRCLQLVLGLLAATELAAALSLGVDLGS